METSSHTSYHFLLMLKTFSTEDKGLKYMRRIVCNYQANKSTFSKISIEIFHSVNPKSILIKIPNPRSGGVRCWQCSLCCAERVQGQLRLLLPSARLHLPHASVCLALAFLNKKQTAPPDYWELTHTRAHKRACTRRQVCRSSGSGSVLTMQTDSRLMNMSWLIGGELMSIQLHSRALTGHTIPFSIACTLKPNTLTSQVLHGSLSYSHRQFH